MCVKGPIVDNAILAVDEMRFLPRSGEGQKCGLIVCRRLDVVGLHQEMYAYCYIF